LRQGQLLKHLMALPREFLNLKQKSSRFIAWLACGCRPGFYLLFIQICL